MDAEGATVPLLLHVHRSKASLYRLLSGASSMHKRGYRDKMHAASLKESVAAGLLLHAGCCSSVRSVAPCFGRLTLLVFHPLHLASRIWPVRRAR